MLGSQEPHGDWEATGMLGWDVDRAVIKGCGTVFLFKWRGKW